MKRLLPLIPLLISTMAIGPCDPITIGTVNGDDAGVNDRRRDGGPDAPGAPDAGIDASGPRGGRAGAPSGGAGGSGGAPSGGAGGATSGGAGGVATGGAAGSPPMTECPAGGWNVDVVPAQSVVGSLLGSTIDNTGHVYELRFYQKPNVPAPPNWIWARYHLVQVRPPYGAWTSFEVVQESDLSTAWAGSNPLAVYGATPLILYMNGAGLESFAQRASFSATGSGDLITHRPPLTWPDALFNMGGSVTVEPSTNERFSIVGGFTADGNSPLTVSTPAGATTFPKRGRSAQLDVDAAKGLYVLYLDGDTQAMTLGSRAAADTAWTFTPSPTGALLVTPDGIPTVLGRGNAGLILNQRKAGAWAATTIDAAGTMGVHGVDTKGTIHVAYSTGSTLRYARLTSTGVLTTEAVTASSRAPSAVRIDARGVVRIFDGAAVYRRCTHDAGFPVTAPLARATWTNGPPSPVQHLSFIDGGGSTLTRYTSRAVYDPRRDRVVVPLYSTSTFTTPFAATWEWDGGGGTWSKRSDTAPASGVSLTFEAAYDVASAQVMAVASDGTFAYDPGTGIWTKLSASTAGGALFYEGTTQALVAVSSGGTSRWDAATKSWVAGPNIGGTQPAGTTLGADLGRQLILAYSSDFKTIWEWSSSGGWTARITPSAVVPDKGGALLYAGNGQMANVDADGQVWLWNTTTATWTQTDAGPVYRLPFGGTYAGGTRILRYGYSGSADVLFNSPPPSWVYLAYVTWQLTVGP